ncbi:MULTISPECIES: NAD(P)H-hydrate dehydratase [unclassified Sphingopyxis]|uniref:NAD(P)H-hydrate dehydratase n=1 Tax=unclassified Sphingopyxis TaxID=2614943 RepID=UPI0006BF30E7|nr:MULTISPECIES: NAD(P)H-hydrate dehydratase [unclassified Sphingopyxis]USI79273.1 NAD(P)H-hydrate dehydratase [Sphingopyxis sp. USTB-05]GAO78285.1 NAD(P)HX epimerase [Sphingopyxis sp. C-1]
MVDPIALDTAWLKANPLPDHHDNVDKNGRGRVLVIGGCRRVPGGMLLTAEAAFRAGAGKVTIATIASAAIPVGIAFPACAVVALPETESGEIAPSSADLLLAEMANHDAIVFGPAMIDEEIVRTLLAALLPALPADIFLLLDAFALRAAAAHADAIAAHGSHTVLTPHEGELAAMLGADKDEVSRDPLVALTLAADRFGAAIMVKGATSHLMAEGTCLSYAGGGLGLAVSGSGDVLAGLIAGLGAQGLAPLQAAAWGIWLHGEAGRRLSEAMGPIGYLARELAPLAPGLMRGV